MPRGAPEAQIRELARGIGIDHPDDVILSKGATDQA
jgi:hypothetical protein